jgi:hypothetical protein
VGHLHNFIVTSIVALPVASCLFAISCLVNASGHFFAILPVGEVGYLAMVTTQVVHALTALTAAVPREDEALHGNPIVFSADKEDTAPKPDQIVNARPRPLRPQRVLHGRVNHIHRKHRQNVCEELRHFPLQSANPVSLFRD